MSKLPGRDRHKGKDRGRIEDGNRGAAGFNHRQGVAKPVSSTAGTTGEALQAGGNAAAAGEGNRRSGKFNPSGAAAIDSDPPRGNRSKKRRRKKRRTSGGTSPDAVASGVNPGTGNGATIPDAERSRDGASHGTHAGSGQSREARNGDGVSGPADISSRRSNGAKRNRGRRKPGEGRADSGGVPRGIRAPVQPSPAARYAPVQRESERQEDAPVRRPAPQRSRKPEDGNLYAALDLGTNNCRLLVALPQQRGRFRVIDGFSRIVRLGEGLAHSGRLSDAAMDRALEALKVCAAKLQNHPVRKARLIATEACRQAQNGEEFIARVRTETGLDLEIINRETEAYLAAEGCGQLMDRKADAAVLFDIGGGSSELMLVDRRSGRKRISDQIVSWTSLPLGVVTLAERHGGKQVDGDIFRAMVSEVKHHLAAFEGRLELERVWQKGRVHLLGTSGTVTTLAGIHLNLDRYDRRRVDGLWMSSGEIDTVVRSLLEMNYHERAASPCVGQERADLVMAGCAILEAIRETWPAERLRVADRGLREGMLTQLISNDGAWLKPKHGRWPRRQSGRGPRPSNGSATRRNGEEQ